MDSIPIPENVDSISVEVEGVPSPVIEKVDSIPIPENVDRISVEVEGVPSPVIEKVDGIPIQENVDSIVSENMNNILEWGRRPRNS